MNTNLASKTVVVTNIQGIEPSLERDPDFAMALKLRHRKLIDQSIENYDFEIYEYKTENLSLLFDDVSNALKFAGELQCQFLEFPRIPVRIGLDYGKVRFENNELSGKTVTTAYEIAKSAKPGSVILSSRVYDQLDEEDAAKAEFIDVFEWSSGVRDVKMYALSDDKLVVPEPEEIKAHIKPMSKIKKIRKSSYQHVLISLGTLIMASAFFAYLNVLSSDPLIDNYSIAVLPFNNLGTDEDSEILSQGFTNDIRNKLSLLEDLVIIASPSSMQYSSVQKNIEEVATVLGVAFLIKGTYHRFGDDIRINTELIEIASKDVVWDKTYNRNYSEIMNIESEIAKDVVDALRLKLSFDDMQNVVGTPTGSIEAYNLYLKGNAAFLENTLKSNARSIEYYSNAIRRDTSFAKAYTALARSILFKVKYGQADIKDVDHLAELYLERAEDINDLNGEIYTLRGYIYNLTGEIEKLKAALEQAYDLLPNDVLTNLIFADYYYKTKQYKKQLLSNKKAYQLDPLNKETALAYVYALVANQKYDEGETLLNKLEKLLDNDEKHVLDREKVNIYLIQHNYRKAIAPLKRLAGNEGAYLGSLAFSFAKTGDTVKVKNTIDSIKTRNDPKLKKYNLAKAYAGLGIKDSAMKYLDSFGIRNIQGGDSIYDFFETFKNDSEFIKFLNRIKARQ